MQRTDGEREERVDYPDSDGEPMADNTEQFDFIVLFETNLDAAREDFVAGDNLWYPVKGDPKTRIAPDVYVAVGRPKGHRGSYKQWEEGGVPLTVVFEWWSPGNDFTHQVGKLRFYERYGVEEFYTFDQLGRSFCAFWREGGSLEPVGTEGGIVSPRLGIRMEVVDGELKAWFADGRPFRTLAELDALRGEAEALAAQAQQEAAQAQQEAARERERAEALAERLRKLGVDPDVPG